MIDFYEIMDLRFYGSVLSYRIIILMEGRKDGRR